MFERFTQEARQVLVGAQEAAQECESRFIRRHHMLIGALEVHSEVIDAVLADAGVERSDLRAKLVASLKASESPAPAFDGTPSFTRESKKALELTLREALALGHNYVAEFHVLLAILRDADGPLAEVLSTTNLDRDRARGVVKATAPDVGAVRRKRVREAVRGRLARRSSRGLQSVLEATYARAADRDATTGDLLVALLESNGTHFAAALKDVTLPDAAIVAAEVDRLLESNADDGTSASVSVDPDSGAVTLQDPVVLADFNRLVDEGMAPNEALIRALRRSR